MRSLIIGMGFGNAVYKPVLESMGNSVITIDPVRSADFKSISDAVLEYKHFDTVNICTPNFTHEALAREIAPYAKLMFVEKPGVVDAKSWQKLVDDFPNTRIALVKNNQHRKEMSVYQQLAEQSQNIRVVWSNNNRVPNPGSWFTTRSLSFGGVSRDLMPHAISYYLKLASWTRGELVSKSCQQRYNLSDLTSTAYGSVNVDGTYDVDDYAELVFKANNKTWTLITDWRSNSGSDQIYISFDNEKFELGLCPEEAYLNMIDTAFRNLNNDAYWREQRQQDLFIHEQLEKL